MSDQSASPGFNAIIEFDDIALWIRKQGEMSIWNKDKYCKIVDKIIFSGNHANNGILEDYIGDETIDNIKAVGKEVDLVEFNKIYNNLKAEAKMSNKMAALNNDLNKMIKKAHLDHLVREDIDVDSIPDDSEEINPDSYMSNPSETVSVVTHPTVNDAINKKIKSLYDQLQFFKDMGNDTAINKDESLEYEMDRIKGEIKDLQELKAKK